MRIVLLILVGGGILWFLIQGFGPSLARDADVARGPGVLLSEDSPGKTPAEPPAAAEVSPASRADAPQSKAAEAPATGAPPAASDTHSAPDTRALGTPAPATATAAPRSADSASLLQIASELVHRPDSFSAWMDSRGADLPAAESCFALAIALRVAGREEEAHAAADKALKELPAGEDCASLLTGGGDESSLLERTTPRTADSALLRAARLALLESVARKSRDGGRWNRAASAYSTLLQEELRAPWPADPESLARWSSALGQVQQNHRWNPKGEWPGLDLKVEPGDNLISLRKRAISHAAGLVTCTGLIARANRIRGDVVQPGQHIRVPLGSPRVVVDLDARWLLFLVDDEVLGSWSIGVGRPGHETAPGEYVVGEKTKDPTWFRPGEPPVPAGDARNPLGTRWIAWLSPDGAKTHLGFHGTQDPGSIGQGDSEGCVRMLNTNVEELFEVLPKGAIVRVQP